MACAHTERCKFRVVPANHFGTCSNIEIAIDIVPIINPAILLGPTRQQFLSHAILHAKASKELLLEPGTAAGDGHGSSVALNPNPPGSLQLIWSDPNG